MKKTLSILILAALPARSRWRPANAEESSGSSTGRVQSISPASCLAIWKPAWWVRSKSNKPSGRCFRSGHIPRAWKLTSNAPSAQ